MNIEEFLIAQGYIKTKLKGFETLARMLQLYLKQRNRWQPVRVYIEDLIALYGGNYSMYQRELNYYVKKVNKRQDLKKEILRLYDIAIDEVSNLHKNDEI